MKSTPFISPTLTLNSCFLVIFDVARYCILEEIDIETEKIGLYEEFKKETRDCDFENYYRTKSAVPKKRETKRKRDENENDTDYFLSSQHSDEISLRDLWSKIWREITSSEEKSGKNEVVFEHVKLLFSRKYESGAPKEFRVCKWRNLVLNAAIDFPTLQHLFEDENDKIGEDVFSSKILDLQVSREKIMWIFLLYSMRKLIFDVDQSTEEALYGSIMSRLRSPVKSRFQFSVALIQRSTREFDEYVDSMKQSKDNSPKFPYYGSEYEEIIMDILSGQKGQETNVSEQPPALTQIQKIIMASKKKEDEEKKTCGSSKIFMDEYRKCVDLRIRNSRERKFNACEQAMKRMLGEEEHSRIFRSSSTNRSVAYGKGYRYFCVVCQKREKMIAEFKMCSRCKIQRYCSRECQKEDWVEHSHHCVMWK